MAERIDVSRCNILVGAVDAITREARIAGAQEAAHHVGTGCIRMAIMRVARAFIDVITDRTRTCKARVARACIATSGIRTGRIGIAHVSS